MGKPVSLFRMATMLSFQALVGYHHYLPAIGPSGGFSTLLPLSDIGTP